MEFNFKNEFQGSWFSGSPFEGLSFAKYVFIPTPN
jgi:hypothetical protein